MGKKDEVETHEVTGVGHNAKPIEGKKLLGIIKSIEKVNAEKERVLQDLREEYADAKALGYDTKMIRKIVNKRKMSVERRKENDELEAAYMAAIGMLNDE